MRSNHSPREAVQVVDREHEHRCPNKPVACGELKVAVRYEAGGEARWAVVNGPLVLVAPINGCPWCHAVLRVLRREGAVQLVQRRVGVEGPRHG